MGRFAGRQSRPYLKAALFIGCITTSLVFVGCKQDKAVYQPAVAKLVQSADALKKANRVDEAICRLHAAVDISPDTFQLHYNLGVLYSQANRWAESAAELEKAVKLSPNDPNAWYTLGYAYTAMGDQAKRPSPTNGSQDMGSGPPTGPSAEMLAMAQAYYQQALQAFDRYMAVAPQTDSGRQQVQQQMRYLQAQLGQAAAH
jgi:tetratricopeptide (TPR) repeat protein